jgi:hypothetical protein
MKAIPCPAGKECGKFAKIVDFRELAWLAANRIAK